VSQHASALSDELEMARACWPGLNAIPARSTDEIFFKDVDLELSFRAPIASNHLRQTWTYSQDSGSTYPLELTYCPAIQ